jgi:phage terminase large subunit-like protein
MNEVAATDRYNWDAQARNWQKEPPGNWTMWLIIADRRLGKTRAGAEWVCKQVETGKRNFIALAGRDMAYVRNIMIEGESGILRCSSSRFRPRYEPSKRHLIWPNGAIATIYAANEIDFRIRGTYHDGFLGDGIDTWQESTWDLLLQSLRLGNNPRGVVTAENSDNDLVKKLMELPSTHVTEA